MAKMKLSESTFTLIPEGAHVFKVVKVNDEKYEDYGKLEVELQTSKGEKHTERFALKKANGEINEGALKAWSYFARVCLNNFNADEIDTQDVVGCYIKATVKHESYEYENKDGESKKGTSARLNDYAVATGFGSKETEVEDESEEDLDDLLDDLI